MAFARRAKASRPPWKSARKPRAKAGAGKASARRKYTRKPSKRSRLINGVAGGVTGSYWSIRGPKLSPRVAQMKRVGAPDIRQWNYGTTIICEQGLQNYASFGSMLQEQVTDILNRAGGNAGNPNRVCLESSQTELTFTNVANCAVEVVLYDIKFKRDLYDLIEFTSNGGNYSFVPTPELMIENGIKAGAGIAQANNPDPSRYIGSSPFDSSVFKDYCTVVKSTKVMLPSGATHRHQTLSKLNKLINRSVGGDSNKLAFKDLTYTTLMYVRGVGAYATKPEPDPVSTATTNSALLNVITSLRVKYTYVSDNTFTLSYGDTLQHEINTVYTRNIGSGEYELVGPV